MTVLGRKPARTVDPAASSDSIASARDLVRRYGDTIALDGVTMSVAPGELVGVLGPNGAGKSTLIALLTGLRRPTSGTVSVLGGDPRLPSTRLRLGVTPQETGLPETLQVHEVVDFVGAHYPDPVATGDLLERFGLSQLARRKTGAMSGGQKRRLAIALAFVGRPDLVFLDEPTTGLDVEARHQLWEQVREFHGAGGTVVLTSHYLEEVEALAQRAVVVAAGRVVADDSVARIRRLVDLSRVVLRADVQPELPNVASVDKEADGRWILSTVDSDQLVRDLVSGGTPFSELEIRAASLEEAFLALA